MDNVMLWLPAIIMASLFSIVLFFDTSLVSIDKVKKTKGKKRG